MFKDFDGTASLGQKEFMDEFLASFEEIRFMSLEQCESALLFAAEQSSSIKEIVRAQFESRVSAIRERLDFLTNVLQ